MVSHEDVGIIELRGELNRDEDPGPVLYEGLCYETHIVGGSAADDVDAIYLRQLLARHA